MNARVTLIIPILLLQLRSQLQRVMTARGLLSRSRPFLVQGLILMTSWLEQESVLMSTRSAIGSILGIKVFGFL